MPNFARPQTPAARRGFVPYKNIAAQYSELCNTRGPVRPAICSVLAQEMRRESGIRPGMGPRMGPRMGPGMGPRRVIGGTKKRKLPKSSKSKSRRIR
jgi:hypothetical protein